MFSWMYVCCLIGQSKQFASPVHESNEVLHQLNAYNKKQQWILIIEYYQTNLYYILKNKLSCRTELQWNKKKFTLKCLCKDCLVMQIVRCRENKTKIDVSGIENEKCEENYIFPPCPLQKLFITRFVITRMANHSLFSPKQLTIIRWTCWIMHNFCHGDIIYF